MRRKTLLLASTTLVLILGVQQLCLAAPEGRPCQAEPTNEFVEYGDVVTCSLEDRNDIDTFRFNGEASDVVVVQAGDVTSIREVRIEVFDPNGVIVATDQVGLAVRLEISGPYSILTSEDGMSGALSSYTLVLDRLSPRSPAAPFVCFGCTIQDELDPLGDLVLFSFNATSGDQIQLQVSDTGLSGTPTSRSTIQRDCESIPRVRSCATLTSTASYTVLINENGVNSPAEYEFFQRDAQ